MHEEITQDAVLGGRLHLRQPRIGHRVGHDAILLAAATGGCPGEHAIELGAGIGAAGLALAARMEDLRVTLVERDPMLAAIASENALLNGLADRVRSATLDVTAPAERFAAVALSAGCADRVLMNPPFNDAARHRPSPQPDRLKAHSASRETLPEWLRTAFRLLTGSGVLTLIWRADGLGRVLALLGDNCGVAVLPVHPRTDLPAIRILVRARKGSRAPLAVHPGLALTDTTGRPTSTAEAVLREGALLSIAVD